MGVIQSWKEMKKFKKLCESLKASQVLKASFSKILKTYFLKVLKASFSKVLKASFANATKGDA